MSVHRVTTVWPEAVSNGLTLPCHFCGHVPAVDYRVDDEEWRRLIPNEARLGVVCIEDFVRLGGCPSRVREVQVIGVGVTAVFREQGVDVYHYDARPKST